MNMTQSTPAHAIPLEALPVSDGTFGHLSLEQRRENRDINDWLEMQDDAEVSFLVAEMAMRGSRSGRLSAYG